MAMDFIYLSYMCNTNGYAYSFFRSRRHAVFLSGEEDWGERTSAAISWRLNYGISWLEKECWKLGENN